MYVCILVVLSKLLLQYMHMYIQFITVVLTVCLIEVFDLQLYLDINFKVLANHKTYKTNQSGYK